MSDEADRDGDGEVSEEEFLRIIGAEGVQHRCGLSWPEVAVLLSDSL